jgi:hypothetical protein
MNDLQQLHSQFYEYFTLKFHPSNEVRTVNTVIFVLTGVDC